MRRKLKKKNEILPDLRFESVKVAKMINYLMWSGKKSTARAVFYDAITYLEEKEKGQNPMEIFEEALRNTAPNMEVRSRRVGGANYQVPREVRTERKLFLSMKWIIEAARSKKGSPMHKRLGDEILFASKNEGEAIKKKENTHKMAEANKAFAHFAW